MKIVRLCVDWLKRNWFWLKWPFAVALLAGLFYQNRQQFGRLTERQIDWLDFGIAFVLTLTAILLTIVRWYLLVWAQEFPFVFKDALRLGFIGYFMTYFAPGAAGGDIVKAVLIAQQQTSRRSVAAATVLLDRILGVVALFMIGALACLLQTPDILSHAVIRIVALALWGGAIAGFLGVTVLLHPAVPRMRWLNRLVQLRFVGRLIREMINALLLYQQRRRVVAAAVAISIVGHFAMLSSFYFCAKALQLGPSAPGYWMHIMLIPGAELVGVVIPTPGGVGALEGAVQYSYSIANDAAGGPVSDDVALASGLFVGVAFRVINIMIASIGALYYFTSRKAVEQALEESTKPVAEATVSR